MGLIDFILNIAGLLLWLNWRSMQFDPMATARPSTLAGTLRRAEAPRLKHWHFPVALGGLLLLRALFYWQIGSAVSWSASLNLAAISISFRSDIFGRMLLFSVFSFTLTLVAFLLWMMFLSLISHLGAEFDGVRKFVRLHIGRAEGWPDWLKLASPLFGAAFLWWLLSWLLVYWEILPQPVSNMHRLEQSFVIALGSYLVWKYVIAGVLVLHLVNSYVYLGSHPLWSNVNAIAHELLRPLRRIPLSVGRVNFAPLIMIVLVFLLSHLAENGLNVPPWSTSRNPPLFKIPGLVDLYRSVSP